MESVLVNYPAIAQRVGRYIAAFALTETLLSAAFARIINDDGRITHAIFHNFKTVSERVTVFGDVVDATNHPAAEVVKPLLDMVRQCAQRRNELAHGMFGGEEQDVVQLFTGITSRRNKGKQIRLTVEDLDAMLAEIGTLNDNLKAVFTAQPGVI